MFLDTFYNDNVDDDDGNSHIFIYLFIMKLVPRYTKKYIIYYNTCAKLAALPERRIIRRVH